MMALRSYVGCGGGVGDGDEVLKSAAWERVNTGKTSRQTKGTHCH